MTGVPEPFLPERYFAEHEFATPHLLRVRCRDGADARSGRRGPGRRVIARHPDRIAWHPPAAVARLDAFLQTA
jgi:hypothetical protein